MIPASPSTPMVMNQIVMIGPNSRPMRAVPCGCSANTRDQHERPITGATYGANEGTGDP